MVGACLVLLAFPVGKGDTNREGDTRLGEGVRVRNENIDMDITQYFPLGRASV